MRRLLAARQVSQLPAAAPAPETHTVLSADVVFRTCIHELARALEQLTSREEIPLYQTAIEFEEAAVKMADFLGAQKCTLKGGHG